MKTVDVENCPIRRALKVLGSKWSFLILIELESTRRYGELKKAIPDITEKMLIEKLRLLEKNKFVVRKDYRQIPPKVEYSLTGLGKETLGLIPGLARIGSRLL